MGASLTRSRFRLARFLPALTLALLAATGTKPADAAGTEPAKLTPLPAYTAVSPALSVLPPGTAQDKPLPKRVQIPPPKLPPPLSPPLTGTPQQRDAVTPWPAAAPAAPAMKAARAETAPPAPAIAVAAPTPAAVPSERGLRTASTEINVRIRPDQDSRRVYTLDQGMVVEVIGPPVNDKWVRVARHGRALGYVASEFLRRPGPAQPQTPPPAPTATDPTERMVRYAATEINVRPRPDQDARRIDVIDEGTALEVIGPVVQKEWIKVARHGRVLGYVSVEYLLPHPPKPH